jgi:hypothetical protein
MSTSGKNDAVTSCEENPVQNEVQRFKSSSTTSQSLFSFIVKMSPLTTLKNKLGIRNHLVMAMQNQPTKITIDIERQGGTSLEPKVDSANSIKELKVDERVLVRVWQRREKSPIDGSFLFKKGWREMGRYRLDDVSVQNVVNEQYLKIRFGIGRDLVPRKAKFPDKDDAAKFQTVLQRMTILKE